MERNSEQMVRYLQQRYTYDAERGVVRNRKGQVIKGYDDKDGYLVLDVRIKNGRECVKLHQVAWVLVYGTFPKQIDHMNGNPRDNRIENLREVSFSENDANRVWAWKPNAKTGLPGVCKSGNNFEINVQGKQLCFRDKFEAFYTLTMLGRMFREQ